MLSALRTVGRRARLSARRMAAAAATRRGAALFHRCAVRASPLHPGQNPMSAVIKRSGGNAVELPSTQAERVVADHVKSGDRVYLHTAAAVPQRLVSAMGQLKGSVSGVEVCHMHVEGRLDYLPTAAEAEAARAAKRPFAFTDNSLFIGKNARGAVEAGIAQYTPVFFSEVPMLFRSGKMPITTALVTTSPPDKHGWMSMGTSVDCSLAAVQTAKHVICQVNSHMPRTHGDGWIHVTQATALVRHDMPLPEHKPEAGNDRELDAIGAHVASLIPDGACLQMGIGAIPDAVLRRLTSHRHLGIHSELFSDGVLPLVAAGVVTGANKRTHPRALVSTFLNGSRALYDFVDDNPAVQMLDVQYVNDPIVIARNPLVHAINSAIEVDLTGQVCADSIGTRFYSGVGGQMDFMRGAALSAGGKPIMALPSQTSKGQSRIVPFLQTGAGVTTTRAHIHYVVTEYGVADLHGKTVLQRAQALAAIAHPNHRDALKQHIAKRYGTSTVYVPAAVPAGAVRDDAPEPGGQRHPVNATANRDLYNRDWH